MDGPVDRRTFSQIVESSWCYWTKAFLKVASLQDSPIIMFTISTAASGLSSSAIVWGFLHFATLCATL
jgi:hypothetical protein